MSGQRGVRSGGGAGTTCVTSRGGEGRGGEGQGISAYLRVSLSGPRLMLISSSEFLSWEVKAWGCAVPVVDGERIADRVD